MIHWFRNQLGSIRSVYLRNNKIYRHNDLQISRDGLASMASFKREIYGRLWKDVYAEMDMGSSV